MFVKKSNILTSEHLIAVAVEPVLFDTILAIAKDAQADGEFDDLVGAQDWLSENLSSIMRWVE